MPDLPEIREIPYTTVDGKTQKAELLPVKVTLDQLTEEEIQVLGHLSRASDGMTPVFARQNYDDIPNLFSHLRGLETTLQRLETTAEDGKEREALNDYMTLLAVSNALWEGDGDLGFKFPVERYQSLLSPEILDVLYNINKAPPSRSLYPEGITEAEFEDLGKLANIVNSSVIRETNGSLRVVLHEERYREELVPVIESLKDALSASKDPDLQEYIRAKIWELRIGSSDLVRKSELAWLENTGRVDFVLGTGIEKYRDSFKKVRGVAQGGIFIEREEYQTLCKTVIDLLSFFEGAAPWEHKKKPNTSNTPKLRFVDVITWSGFYNAFPALTVAAVLPNDKSFRDEYGSINMVFTNVEEAISNSERGSYIKREFFLDKEVALYENLLFQMSLKINAAHEVGHITGEVVIDEEPLNHFGKEYFLLEECRADVFSMWALPYITKTEEEEIAGYYAMLSLIMNSMRKEPTDHNGGRNMMFNYFLKHGAIVEREEHGKTKYVANPEEMRKVVYSMLGELGDIKATGDKKGLKKFKAQYLSKERKAEFEKRMEDMPLGAGLIFPTIVNDRTKYTKELAYPATFRDQPRTLGHFV